MRRANCWFVLGSSLAVGFGAVVLAGDLTPPAGPVVSTMKDLDEVEPRIAVNATNTPGDATNTFIISQPGSYYLERNILGEAAKNGINITAKNVTLDLEGFTIEGVAGSLSGIYMPLFRENIVIRNGFVVTWGASGISARIDYGRIEKIVATKNGGWGIDNHGGGTFTTRIIECEADANGFAVANTGGIRGQNNSIIKDCSTFRNTGAGIEVTSNSMVFNNICQSNLTNSALGSVGRGIHVTGTECLIDGNTVIGGADGIFLAVGSNVVVRNSVGGLAGTGYISGGGDDVAQVNSAALATNPMGNILH